jgi:hypothetical protein
MPNGDSLPLHSEGLNILGCPVGPPEYWTVHLSKIVADIQKNLDALSAFLSLHQQTNFATWLSTVAIHISRT